MLAKGNLNSIYNLVSQALIDIEISPKEFITVLNEKDTYKKMKENVKIMKSTDELNKEKGKKIKATEL